MDEKIKEILDQYELEVKGVCRVRGAYVFDTNGGMRILREFRSTDTKAELAQQVKEHLEKQGCFKVDLYERNKEGKLITETAMGNRYVLKRWFKGEDCDLKKMEHVELAARHLAKLHKAMCHVTETPLVFQADTFQERFLKHNRELRRVRSYIKDKKQRNEFELLFLSVFSEFYQEAEAAEEQLKKIDVAQLYEKVTADQTMCHGSYNYHNLIVTKSGMATGNFEKTHLQLQVMDLYEFVRKLMEKTSWNFDVLKRVISSYEKEKPLTPEEKQVLRVSLLYPEKFWKISNYYINNKKTWMSGKKIDKIQRLQQQKNSRRLLLERLEEI